MNKTVRAFIFWAVIVVSSVLLWQVVRAGNVQAAPEISYSRFLAQIADGQVSKVVIAGCVVHGTDAKGNGFRVVTAANQYLMLEALQQHGVEIWFKNVSGDSWPLQLLGTWAPLILLAALWFFMIRQMKTANRARSTGQVTSGSVSTPESPTCFGP